MCHSAPTTHLYCFVIGQKFRFRFRLAAQVQKIASESMIPTYRSGTEPLQKGGKQGQSEQQQQSGQQQNNGSFSAKGDNTNAVSNAFQPCVARRMDNFLYNNALCLRIHLQEKTTYGRLRVLTAPPTITTGI